MQHEQFLLNGESKDLVRFINHFSRFDSGFASKRYDVQVMYDERIQILVKAGDRWPWTPLCIGIQMQSNDNSRIIRFDLQIDDENYAAWGQSAYTKLINGLIGYGIIARFRARRKKK